jgi:hypothetical protein
MYICVYDSNTFFTKHAVGRGVNVGVAPCIILDFLYIAFSRHSG